MVPLARSITAFIFSALVTLRSLSLGGLSNLHTGIGKRSVELLDSKSFVSDVGPWIAFDSRQGGPLDVIPGDEKSLLRHRAEIEGAVE